MSDLQSNDSISLFSVIVSVINVIVWSALTAYSHKWELLVITGAAALVAIALIVLKEGN